MKDLKFAYMRDHVTLEMLNEAYGSKGRTFKTRSEAEKFAASIRGKTYISRIVNYMVQDFLDGKLIKGRKPLCKGYLVTIEGWA